MSFGHLGQQKADRPQSLGRLRRVTTKIKKKKKVEPQPIVEHNKSFETRNLERPLSQGPEGQLGEGKTRIIQ